MKYDQVMVNIQMGVVAELHSMQKGQAMYNCKAALRTSGQHFSIPYLNGTNNQLFPLLIREAAIWWRIPDGAWE